MGEELSGLLGGVYMDNLAVQLVEVVGRDVGVVFDQEHREGGNDEAFGDRR